jgi:radical SAM enzyme (TIGR01210 family)
LKLYNAGSFFDRAAIPDEDDAAIAERGRAFERLIVESHPALVGARCWRFRDRLAAGGGAKGTSLEVAMGLETAHEEVFDKLNEGISLEDFAQATEALRREGVAWRAFVLVQPPFEKPHDAVFWAVRSAARSFDLGAAAVSLIPIRAGNGALEELRRTGDFVPTTLSTFEQAVDQSLALRRGRVFADVWDLPRLSACPVCFELRRERLERMNSLQDPLPRVTCAACGA